MKKNQLLFLAIAFLSINFTMQAQRGVRVGYIDMEYILENVPEYREAGTQLDGKVQRWKVDIEKKQAEIDLMKLTLTNERVLLTKELISEREEDIQIKEDEKIAYQQGKFGPKGDLVIQRRQLVQPIQDQVFNIVQDIAEAKKYDFIFDKSADVVMLFAAKRNDISEQVLRSINRSEKRKEATSRKEKREIQQRDDLSLEEDKEVTKRDIETEAKQTAREQIMNERKNQRDSIRAAKKTEYDAKRAHLLEIRQRKRDSAQALKNGTPWPPEGSDNESENKTQEANEKTSPEEEGSKEDNVKTETEKKQNALDQIMKDRKKERDSIRAVKKATYDAKRIKLLESRQRKKDSIQAIRNGTPWPLENNTPSEEEEEEEDGGKK
jgi:Skp family chaperone for outer membrane proteins